MNRMRPVPSAAEHTQPGWADQRAHPLRICGEAHQRDRGKGQLQAQQGLAEDQQPGNAALPEA